MVHLVFATRGIMHQTLLFEAMMQSNWWPLSVEKDGKKVHVVDVQGALRPINFYEYVIPEDGLDELLTSLDIAEGGFVHPLPARINQKIMQKAMGLEPIPKKWNKTVKRHMPRADVALYPIGIKRDNYTEQTSNTLVTQKFKQEML